MRFLFENFEALMPLIVIAVMVLSGSFKKKRGEGRDAPPRPREDMLDDEMRDMLEDIFQAKELPAPVQVPVDYDAEKQKKIAAQRAVNKAAAKKAEAGSAYAHRGHHQVHHKQNAQNDAAYTITAHDPKPSAELIKGARNGFIWSEILLPPVSCR